MRIPRVHLFELEDQSWFPAVIRDLATDYLHFAEGQLRLHEPMAGPLARALAETQSRRVIDLCSGGSGPVVALSKELADRGLELQFILTDRFPNLPAFERFKSASNGRIDFTAEPVDARAVPTALTGFRTMFNAFHHFRPDDGIRILRDAGKARQPIAIFDVPDRTAFVIAMTFLLTPFLVLLATPFIRPFHWRRLLWTYLLPAVPLTCWWDGVVSMLRAYRADELQALADEAGVEDYAWESGYLSMGARGRVTYLIGLPGDS